MILVTIILKNQITVKDKVTQENYQQLLNVWRDYLGGLRKSRLVVLDGLTHHGNFDADSIACIVTD